MSEAARSDRATDAAQYPPYFSDLYARSEAATFGLSFGQFADVLQEISGKYLPAGANQGDAAALHRSLRLEELALARACAAGSESAWECFVSRYRQKLHLIAAAMTHEESSARELADSLYTDLYGTRQTDDGGRVSKLASYSGRGSLEGWLRTIVAQQYVECYRRERRLVSFDERLAGAAEARTIIDDRLEKAVDTALAELSAEERFILAAWYLDGRTLAEIGRMLGVHESTISRRVDRIVAGVRKRIVRRLKELGISGKEAEEMMKTDVRDLALDIRGRLVQEKRG